MVSTHTSISADVRIFSANGNYELTHSPMIKMSCDNEDASTALWSWVPLFDFLAPYILWRQVRAAASAITQVDIIFTPFDTRTH